MPDPPAAMRERLDEYKKQAHCGWNTLVLYIERDKKELMWPVIEGIAQLLFTYIPQLEKENRELRQAALPSPERIEAIARTIAGQCSAGKRMVEEDVAAILREELGGGTE